MSESTIEWTNFTGGPWLICTEKSPGCLNCYARKLMEARLAKLVREAYRKAGLEDWDTRDVWGKNAPRVLTKGFWSDVRALNKKSAGAAERPKLFPSLIDWLDEMPAGIIDQNGNRLDPIAVLADFLKTIHDCPNLDFLLLTKRPENFFSRLQTAWRMLAAKDETLPVAMFIANWEMGVDVPQNIWLGVSVEDQTRADERIPELLKIPAKVRFLSCEPLLEEVDLKLIRVQDRTVTIKENIDWVIVGGESGPDSRPCGVSWIRSIVKQCNNAGVACFVKQLGAHIVTETTFGWPETKWTDSNHGYARPVLKDKKGGDMNEWPEDLRVRQFPKA